MSGLIKFSLMFHYSRICNTRKKLLFFPLLQNETFIHSRRKLLVRVVHGLSDTVGTNCSCRWEQVVSTICYSFL